MDLVPSDVYVDGQVIDKANYNQGIYHTTPANGRYSVLNGNIENANLAPSFVAPRRLLWPGQGVRGHAGTRRSENSYYSDYATSGEDDDLFTVHSVALDVDLPFACSFLMWQAQVYISHWRGFSTGADEVAVGEQQDMRYRLRLNGTNLTETTRGLGCSVLHNLTTALGGVDIREDSHQRFTNLSWMQKPAAAGRHRLEMRVYMKLEVIEDTHEVDIAEITPQVDFRYYSRCTFGFGGVVAVAFP